MSCILSHVVRVKVFSPSMGPLLIGYPSLQTAFSCTLVLKDASIIFARGSTGVCPRIESPRTQ
jgi:hypothetical protein